jgi:hypothetical protein
MSGAEGTAEPKVFAVAIGLAASQAAGWQFSHNGRAVFLPGRIAVTGRKWLPTASLIAGAAGGVIGAAVAWPVTSRLDADATYEIDPARGRALYDSRRRVVKAELPDGRWVVLTQNGSFEGGQLTNRVSPARREAFARSLQRAYGDRLSHAAVVNRRVRAALWVLLAFCLPLAALLILLAILGAMGLL